MTHATYMPEHWFESTVRTLKDYAEENFNSRIYDIVMEFPGAIVDAAKLPMAKTIIHFELDAIDSAPVGFGDGMFEDNYDPAAHTIQPQYATKHMLTYDVGVWASDKSGGTTQRMRARQQLEFMFGRNNGGAGRFMEFSDNDDGRIEVISFTGGRFVLDNSANGFRLYRMVDCMLELRVFSRTPISLQDPIPAVEGVLQDNSGVTIR